MSTAVELAGFSALVVASFIWQSVQLQVVTGCVTLGVILLLIGYALDGRAVSVPFTKLSRVFRDLIKRRKATDVADSKASLG